MMRMHGECSKSTEQHAMLRETNEDEVISQKRILEHV